jgi:hypothetical protein
VCHATSLGRPCVPDATMEQLESFSRIPRKSTRCASLEAGTPNVTVWRVLRKRLNLKAYKLSIAQHLTDSDKTVRKEFCMQMFQRIHDDERFLDSVIFSNKDTCLPGTCSWQPKSELVLRPQQRNSVRPLLLHGDDHYLVSCIWTCSNSSSSHS